MLCFLLDVWTISDYSVFSASIRLLIFVTIFVPKYPRGAMLSQNKFVNPETLKACLRRAPRVALGAQQGVGGCTGRGRCSIPPDFLKFPRAHPYVPQELEHILQLTSSYFPEIPSHSLPPSPNISPKHFQKPSWIFPGQHSATP